MREADGYIRKLGGPLGVLSLVSKFIRPQIRYGAAFREVHQDRWVLDVKDWSPLLLKELAAFKRDYRVVASDAELEKALDNAVSLRQMTHNAEEKYAAEVIPTDVAIAAAMVEHGGFEHCAVLCRNATYATGRALSEAAVCAGLCQDTIESSDADDDEYHAVAAVGKAEMRPAITVYPPLPANASETAKTFERLFNKATKVRSAGDEYRGGIVDPAGEIEQADEGKKTPRLQTKIAAAGPVPEYQATNRVQKPEMRQSTASPVLPAKKLTFKQVWWRKMVAENHEEYQKQKALLDPKVSPKKHPGHLNTILKSGGAPQVHRSNTAATDLTPLQRLNLNPAERLTVAESLEVVEAIAEANKKIKFNAPTADGDGVRRSSKLARERRLKKEAARRAALAKTKWVNVDQLERIPHNWPGEGDGVFRVPDINSDDEMEVEKDAPMRVNIFEYARHQGAVKGVVQDGAEEAQKEVEEAPIVEEPRKDIGTQTHTPVAHQMVQTQVGRPSSHQINTTARLIVPSRATALQRFGFYGTRQDLLNYHKHSPKRVQGLINDWSLEQVKLVGNGPDEELSVAVVYPEKTFRIK